MKITKKKLLVIAFVGGLVYLFLRGRKLSTPTNTSETPTVNKVEGKKYVLKQDFKKEELNIPLNKKVVYEFKKGQTIIGAVSPEKDTRFKTEKDSIATTPKGTLPNFDKFNEDWVEIPISYLEKQ